MKRNLRLFVICGTLGAPAVALAQDAPAAPAGEKAPPSAQLPSFGFSGAKGVTAPPSVPTDAKSAGAALGFGQIGEDYYLRLNVGFEMNLGKIGLGVQAPLNILAYEGCGDEVMGRCTNKFDGMPDAMPPIESSRDQKTYGGVLRKQDYDEVSDYGKFIRYVRYGHKGDPLHLHVGELGGMSIGHGTLVGRYMNNVSVDHTKFGLVVDVDHDFGGVETLFDNIVSEGDDGKSFGGEAVGLFAGRAYVRPLMIANIQIPFVRRLALGVSYAIDRRVPIVLKKDPSDPTGNRFDLDDKGNFERDASAAEDSFQAVGLDVELPLLESSIIRLVPYIDYNILGDVKNPLRAAMPMMPAGTSAQVDAGSGLHIGAMLGFQFPILLDISLSARLEYRYLGDGYLPAYFDSNYDLQRYQYPVTIDPTQCRQMGGIYDTDQSSCYAPKAAALAFTGEARNGVYGEVAFKFMNLVVIGGGAEDYEGPQNGVLNLYGTVPMLADIASITAFYSRRAIDITQEAFALDERSLLGAVAKVKLSGPLYLVAMYTRQWAADPASGRVEGVDNYNFGVELNFAF